jgi:hypothetical protein
MKVKFQQLKKFFDSYTAKFNLENKKDQKNTILKSRG